MSKKTIDYKYKHNVNAIQSKLTFKNGELNLINKEKPHMKDTYEHPIFLKCKPYCPWSLRIDPYLSCEHGCSYCYAKATYTRVNLWGKIRPSNITKISDIFDKAFSKRSFEEGTLLHTIKNKYPAKVGVMTDPFQPCENNLHITEAIIKIALKYDYPMFFITKGIINNDCINLMAKKPENFIIDQSIITLDETLKKKLESNTPAIKDRIELANKLTSKGIHVKVNAKPTIPNISANLEFIDKLTDIHPTDHVAFEYLYLSYVTTPILRKLGYDFTNDMTLREDEFFHFQNKSKRKFLIDARQLLHKKGIKFGTCDLSFQSLNDSPICCGITNEKKFLDIMTDSSCIQTMLKIAKLNNGNVNYNEFSNTVKFWKIPKDKFKKLFESGKFEIQDLSDYNKTKNSYSFDLNWFNKNQSIQ
jgi:DNA repair photolyase